MFGDCGLNNTVIGQGLDYNNSALHVTSLESPEGLSLFLRPLVFKVCSRLGLFDGYKKGKGQKPSEGTEGSAQGAELLGVGFWQQLSRSTTKQD